MSERRCVVVGDVVASRDREERESLREALANGLERANDRVDDALVAPFRVLKGVDEVGGVLADPSEAYAPLCAIAEAIHPVGIRFAVVYDTVDVAADGDDVAAMDGPAFHRADELLESVDARDRAVGLDLGADDVLEPLLADHLDLLALWKGDWTARQGEVVRTYRREETMAAAADALDVSVQAVSQTLAAARASTVFEMEARLEETFAHLATEVAA
jgi:hypothetical protein